MPDFINQPFYHCESAEYFAVVINNYNVVYDDANGIHSWRCECKGFKYYKKCKHIEEAKKKHCGWMQFSDGGDIVNNKCPRCKAEVKLRLWAV